MTEPNLESLHALFSPRSVAVVGASKKRGSVGGEIFHNLLRCGFTGPVYPVNPTTTSVQSVRAYARLADIPGEVDLAVIVVPKERVLEVVEECAAKKVKAVIVISAGFGETGEAGRALQQKLVDTVRRGGMRMVGPNCLGLLNTDSTVQLNATFAPTWPPAGSVSFSSQSGALGLAILDYASELGIGVRHFVSVGNKADVSGNDLINYWGEDPGTKIILLYLESFGNPRNFMEAARRIGRTKPIVAVKSGRTESGARAASSHTGSLAGVDIAVDALLGQAGVIRTDTIEELFDLAMLLANQPVPKGRRVGIITNAGGPGIMASDACESRGLVVTTLSDITQNRLREFLPAEASVRNPVDMIASAPATSFERAVRLLVEDPDIDALMVLFVPPVVTEAEAVAEAIQRGAQGTDKPVLTCFMGTHGVPPALRSLRAQHFPSYAFPEAGALALSRAVRYGEWRRAPAGKVERFADTDLGRARAIISTALARPGSGPERWLRPDEVEGVLSAYGIRIAVTRMVTSADAAAEAAETLGGAVALKLHSERLTHKSDVGGVVLGLRGGEAARQAYRDMEARVTTSFGAGVMQGAIVQPMLDKGVETFVGMTLDPAFGPLLAFGTGGTAVELWRDVVFRVHPLRDVDAVEMLEQIRGKKLLDGFRGAPPADRAALREALLRTSQLVGDLPEIVELDINPLIAWAPGRGAIAADARIRVRKGGA